MGQNLYVYKQSLRRADTDWERAVKDWYEEVMLFSRDKVGHWSVVDGVSKTFTCFSLAFCCVLQVEPFQFSSEIGHYSQLVWAETDKVVCVDSSVM